MLTALLSAVCRARSVPSRGWKVLTSKQAKRRYKGKGSFKTGYPTARGGFRPEPSMLPAYVVPDLTGFTLRPYVANYPEQAARRTRGSGSSGGASSGGASSGAGDAPRTGGKH